MIDVTKIKQLREKTSAGISECREALDKTNGNLVKAATWLKEQGITKASKKADRETKQGLVESYVHANGKIGVLVEVNCETDFVARTQDFKNLCHELALQISAMSPKNVKILLEQPYIRDQQLTVEQLVKSVIGKLGENIKINRFSRLELGE